MRVMVQPVLGEAKKPAAHPVIGEAVAGEADSVGSIEVGIKANWCSRLSTEKKRPHICCCMQPLQEY